MIRLTTLEKLREALRHRPEHHVEKFLEVLSKEHAVYEKFVTIARQAKNMGMERYGAKTIFERLRWHENVEMKNEDFKLNNTYATYFAEAAMFLNEDLRGFFEVRKRRM